MTLRSVLRGALAVASCILAGPGAEGAGCVPISSTPVRITSPGDYCLTRDLAHTELEPAITIAAADVHLDLRGFTLSGPALTAYPTFGITTEFRRGLVVRNGRVRGFRIGLDLVADPEAGPLIEDLEVDSVHLVGIRALGAGVTVRRCRVSAVGGSTMEGDQIPVGIMVSGPGTVVAGNTVTDVRRPPVAGGEAVGIAVANAVGAVVQDNVIVNPELQPDSWAIWLSPPMDVHVDRNLIAYYATGIAFSAESAGTYAGNRFLDVTAPVIPLRWPPVRDGGGNRYIHPACHPVLSLPWIIDSPGRYCLVRNLSTGRADGPAVEITSDDVVLDLGGFKLGGGSAGSGTRAVGVLARDRTNVTVRNGDVTGFLVGVELRDGSGAYASSGHLVEGIRAVGNTWMGVWVQGRGSVVRRNQVLDTTGTTAFGSADTFGIRSDGPLARVLDNDVLDTIGVGGGAGSGIALYDGNASVVERNRVGTDANGGEFAIRLASGDDILATANRMAGPRYGIVFQGLATGRYRDNVSAGVDVPYLPEGAPFDAGDNE